jgi:hypothetical protein
VSSRGPSEPVKPYEAEGFYFEFSPNGSPYVGTLRATDEAESGPYEAEVNLQKAGSRERYARKAAELYGMDGTDLERALNEVCTRRSEEVAAAEQAEANSAAEAPGPVDVGSERHERAMELLKRPDILEEAAQDMERLGHVGERGTKKLALICALSAKSGKPIQPSTHAQSSAGKNALWDATLSLFPEEMVVRRSGLTAKALFRTEANLQGAILYLQRSRARRTPTTPSA